MEIAVLSMTVREIIPPLPNGCKYAAKVKELLVTQGEGEDEVPIADEFGEIWGRTSSEAISKMTSHVGEWVSKQ